MYIRKTEDEWVIFGNYGYGWDELCCYDSYAEAKADYRAYRENEPNYPHKLIKRRIKKEAN